MIPVTKSRSALQSRAIRSRHDRQAAELLVGTQVGPVSRNLRAGIGREVSQISLDLGRGYMSGVLLVPPRLSTPGPRQI